MSYKACFECELVFEVDDAAARCPECDRALEEYEPDNDELGEGAANESVDSAETDFNTAEPTQALSVVRLPEPADDDGGDLRTRMLKIPDGLMTAGLSPRNPALEKTEAIKVDNAPKPLPPLAPRKPQDRRSVFGQTGPGQDDDSAPRHTRVASVDDGLAQRADPSPAPQRAAVPAKSPERTAQAVRTAEAPAPKRRPTPRAPGPEMGRPTVSVFRPTGPPRGLIVGGVAGAVALVAGLFFAFSGGAGEHATPDAGPAAPVLSWSAKLSKQLEDAQTYLPVLGGVPKVEEGPYIAGGLEGFASSFGTIVGLPSTKIAESIIDRDADGEWVRPLRAALERQVADRDSPLSLAFDAKMPSKAFLRLAVAAERAGRSQLQLLVGREEGQGELGAIPFGAWRGSSKLPTGGAVIARIGQLGFHITVKDGSGQLISAGPNMIERKRKALDYKAFGERLRALRDAHPGVETIIVYPNPETPLEQLATVLAKAAFDAAGQQRFQHTRIASR